MSDFLETMSGMVNTQLISRIFAKPVTNGWIVTATVGSEQVPISPATNSLEDAKLQIKTLLDNLQRSVHED